MLRWKKGALNRVRTENRRVVRDSGGGCSGFGSATTRADAEPYTGWLVPTRRPKLALRPKRPYRCAPPSCAYWMRSTRALPGTCIRSRCIVAVASCSFENTPAVIWYCTASPAGTSRIRTANPSGSNRAW